ncbi:hypothetical protein GGS23DRAFT_37760 [Durotheca rogersii]|uniref:uncharacterized protein n=1 Tax=Durotheca rogersii TaxID=419775 RepID=UPI00221F571A|nr:uncharacterized protein GGS23DRAFT_37760 [Durotheca rogersii]KAI5868576.1 hypothetical protein GGS23DRAFT_37760 [Durotheca rogersii]
MSWLEWAAGLLVACSVHEGNPIKNLHNPAGLLLLQRASNLSPAMILGATLQVCHRGWCVWHVQKDEGVPLLLPAPRGKGEKREPARDTDGPGQQVKVAMTTATATRRDIHREAQMLVCLCVRMGVGVSIYKLCVKGVRLLSAYWNGVCGWVVSVSESARERKSEKLRQHTYLREREPGDGQRKRRSKNSQSKTRDRQRGRERKARDSM